MKIFPLSAHICRRFYDQRILFIGDAAHSLHPIAGQGWNLGIRDIKYLVETFEKSKELGLDIGSLQVLKKYNDKRFTDTSNLLFITHGLNKIFSCKLKTFDIIRSIGFDYISSNRKLNKKLVNYAMGISL